MKGFGFRAHGFWFRVSGLGFGFYGLGFRVGGEIDPPWGEGRLQGTSS